MASSSGHYGMQRDQTPGFGGTRFAVCVVKGLTNAAASVASVARLEDYAERCSLDCTLFLYIAHTYVDQPHGARVQCIAQNALGHQAHAGDD